MKNRKVCVVTGSRADYGLLYWLLRELDSAPDLDLQLIITGAHLEEAFGRTVQIIKADGFPIAGLVDTSLAGDDSVAVAQSMGTCLSGIAAELQRLGPDVMVVTGDRFEMLAAATAALVGRIPLAHIHGGETTEGAFDEAIRHSLTKMSHLHFVAAEPYRDRVVQMGENPNRVFNVGAPGLDNIKKLNLLNREQLSEVLDFDIHGSLFLATYHPETLSDRSQLELVGEFLSAIEAFPQSKVVITGVNSDPGNRAISQAIHEFSGTRSDKILVTNNLGQVNYLSAMQAADVVIGNSSSGIFEAPALKKPSVNIGDRQKGRLRATSVIDCRNEHDDIVDAITKALSADFKKIAAKTSSLFGDGGSSTKIYKCLRDTPLEDVLMKSFFDIPLPSGLVGTVSRNGQ